MSIARFHTPSVWMAPSARLQDSNPPKRLLKKLRVSSCPKDPLASERHHNPPPPTYARMKGPSFLVLSKVSGIVAPARRGQ